MSLPAKTKRRWGGAAMLSLRRKACAPPDYLLFRVSLVLLVGLGSLSLLSLPVEHFILDLPGGGATTLQRALSGYKPASRSRLLLGVFWSSDVQVLQDYGFTSEALAALPGPYVKLMQVRS